jgi:hypothetical protein
MTAALRMRRDVLQSIGQSQEQIVAATSDMHETVVATRKAIAQSRASMRQTDDLLARR